MTDKDENENNVTIEDKEIRGDYIYGNKIGIGMLFPKATRSDLREWWFSILRDHGRFPCCAFFLVLPADKNVIDYMVNSGKEIDLISGQNCMVLALTKNPIRFDEFDMEKWKNASNDHIDRGYSLQIAEYLGIDLTEFPCLVFLKDIRSREFVSVSLKGMSQEEITEKLRLIFSLIRTAVANKQEPLEILQAQRTSENLRQGGNSIVSVVKTFAKKTFETAIEAVVKASIGQP